MALKHGGLRRALYALVLFGVGLCVYLYWAQVGKDFPSIAPRFRQTNSGRRYAETLWTWVCTASRCERREKTKEQAATSLETCNMLCGSTQLWPQPTGPVQLGSHYITFFPHQIRFETSAQGPERNLLEKAYAIFRANINYLINEEIEPGSYRSDINEFIVKIIVSLHNHTMLRLNTDESYNLTVRPSEKDLIATIRAKTFYGARHGLETLSQLIWSDDTELGPVLRVLKGASIQDSPKFAYRGLMLDTSRHFFSIAALKRMLTGMASCKLNIFHWHLTDSQSFPFDSPRVPQMTKYGALAPEMIYSAEDIKDLVQFAKVRGIRILIEMDTPAHAGNGWNWGPYENLGELAVCVNQQPWSLYCGEPPCGQLNPDNPNVYKVLENLYRDILELTEEKEIFHLGGDEVNLHCWEQHQTKISTPYNYTDLHDTWGEFTVQAMKRLEQANNGRIIPNIIMWSSDLTKRPYIEKYLNKHRTIVQTWGGSTWPETIDLLEDGYRVIISHVDAWYLDCGFGKWRETGGAACDPYRTWQTVYTHRPWQRMRITGSKRSLVLGGEACLWTEQVDESSLDTRLWPRAAALAERLWSDPNLDLDTLAIQEDVYTRLNTHRDRLVTRGLNAEAMWPKWCAQNPGMCL